MTLTRPGTLVGKVLSLVAAAMGVTALAALFAPPGGGWALIGGIAAIACIILLAFCKEVAGLNLVLYFGAAAGLGIGVGQVLESYIAHGAGMLVVDAAVTTAAITLAAGLVGWTTQRDLSGLGSILFIGLISVIVASFVGIFVHLPGLYLAISVVTAALFTGYLVYDTNQVVHSGNASDGDAIVMALGIWLDILNLFLALLRILSQLSGRD